MEPKKSESLVLVFQVFLLVMARPARHMIVCSSGMAKEGTEGCNDTGSKMGGWTGLELGLDFVKRYPCAIRPRWMDGWTFVGG
jgi:hypothetical protein